MASEPGRWHPPPSVRPERPDAALARLAPLDVPVRGPALGDVVATAYPHLLEDTVDLT